VAILHSISLTLRAALKRALTLFNIEAVQGAVFLLLISTTSSIAAGSLIGRWCDWPIPNMDNLDNLMTITTDDKGEVYLERFYKSGRESKVLLRRISNTKFNTVGSATGNNYRIQKGSGHLQIRDNEGLIRSARRLENSMVDGECRR